MADPDTPVPVDVQATDDDTWPSARPAPAVAETEESRPGQEQEQDQTQQEQTQQEEPQEQEQEPEAAEADEQPQQDDHHDAPSPPPHDAALAVPSFPSGPSHSPRSSEQIFDQRTHVDARPRTDSQSTTATTATTARPSTRSSLVFVVTALETIAASKDARKNKKLGDATNAALAEIKSEGDPARINPELLFEPLHLASEAPNVPVSITALDCIGKLISYSYFSVPAEHNPAAAPDAPDAAPLIERAIDTICDCFQGEATHPDVQLQIVKSLLAAILNDKIVVHGAGLLKAVRLTYNIFLLSKSSANQQVAQGALAQMVGTVFERVKARLAVKEARINLSRASLNDKDQSEDSIHEEVDDETQDIDDSGTQGDADEQIDADPSDTPVVMHTGPKITLQSFENNMSFNDDRIHDNAPTLVTRIKAKSGSRNSSGQDPHSAAQNGNDGSEEEEEDEIFVKDAYLVFRAMCRLSTKGLSVDHATDVRSQGMRSKLLSLHMVHTILHNNIAVFISPYATIRSGSGDEPTTFIQAIKQYLCLSLSRDGLAVSFVA
jgi:brefeldin A-inhibited guanine nucleotide-exchange protein